MNILIIDDSSAMRMVVKKTLRMAGFEGHTISEAEDGAAALERIRQSVPDLVLSDWNMPNLSGIDLLAKLGEEGIKVNFGFVTTEATAEMRDKAAGAGAKFLIAKPFTPETFSMTLAPFIKN
ncbi:MAG: response regulator [Gammaproteobacteria bacterium]